MFSYISAIFISFTTAIVPILATDPLFLTPLIKQNKLAEARNASYVPHEKFHFVESYSGFLTVNERFDSNLFFWYFPYAFKDHKETPWIIWLQGGPGGSSLVGLFLEMGPFRVVDGTIELREFSWCKEFSMVFIDNPVGAGFSFTDNEEGYPRNSDSYSNNLYEAAKQLTILFPELGRTPLYIAGESYAGRYVPNFAMKIFEERHTDHNINLKGLIMGNPVIDRDSIADYTRVYYNWGLLDAQGALFVKPLQEEYAQAVVDEDFRLADELRTKLLDLLSHMSLRHEMYNVIKDNAVGDRNFVSLIKTKEVREAIHVGNKDFIFSNQKLHRYLEAEFALRVSPKVEILLENYKVMIYCGQLDLTAPCVLNAEGVRDKWRWRGRDAFLAAPRVPWLFDRTVAGYVKSGGNLSEVLIMGAGHLSPADKPQQVQQLISYFINGIDLPKPAYYESVDIPDYGMYTDLHYSAYMKRVKSGLLASVVVNVLLVIGVVVGAVVAYRWNRKYLVVVNDGLTMA